MTGMEFKCFRVNQYSPPKRAENCVEIPEIILQNTLQEIIHNYISSASSVNLTKVTDIKALPTLFIVTHL